MKKYETIKNEIFENLVKEMQKIIFMKATQSTKKRLFYKAKYWAEYFMYLDSEVQRQIKQELSVQNKNSKN